MTNLNPAVFCRSLLFVFFAGALFSACSSAEIEPGEGSKKYFDLKALIAQTAEDLQKKKAVKKSDVLLNETASSSADREVNWLRELSLFADADINAPVLRDEYSVKEETNSLIYTAKSEDAKIRRMVVEKENGRPVRVEIDSRSGNLFFTGERRLSLLFGPDNLKEYRLKGFRKMVLRDTLHFSSSVKISIP